MNRRDFLAAAATATTLGAAPAPASEPQRGPFKHRGYYTLGTRYPTAGLAAWKRILSAMQADGCNLLVHWVAGGFRSKKYPETWAHNADHENVKADFTRALIDDAAAKGIRVILGFTPFGYDGVNLMTKARPEWRSVAKGGKPTGEFGIGCWGHSLCPAQPACQEFMLGYVREMLFDFYPNAGGLFVESSDYSTCFCDRCKVNDGSGHFDQEYRFVKAISDEAWAKNPDAMVVVYPHYFSGDISTHTAGKARAATQPFDPRWTLFFTPHSTKPNPALMRKAKDSLWWDEAMVFGTPEAVKDGATRAAAQGFTGYVPTLEAYSFVATHDEGEPWTKGRRQVPFGIGWVPPGQSAYDELPIRVARIAYREFARNPELPPADFRGLLGREVFGEVATDRHVTDLLTLQRCFSRDRSWALPSPLVEPLRVRWFAESGQLKPERKADLRKAVEELRAIAQRYAGGTGGEAELAKAARWVADRWAGDDGKLLGLEAAK